MDVGCYCVSGARTLAGAEPRARLRRAGDRRPTASTSPSPALLRFPGDVLAPLDCGLASPPATSSRRSASEGSLFLDDPWHGREPVIEVRRTASRSSARGRSATPYALELEDFEAAARGERPPLLGRDDARRRRRARSRALYASAAQRRDARDATEQPMKTSLGIWAFGPMVTRFVPVGYQPEHGDEPTAEKVRARGRAASAT